MALSRDTDVFIAGGGPAGLGAAIACCQRGLRVVVADGCRPPIEKPCGEGLMPEAMSALCGLGVDFAPGECAALGGVRFQGVDVAVEAMFPSGRGVGVRRRVLHQALVASAERAGAELVWGARVTGISGAGAWVDGDLVRCRWLVGADGTNSAVRSGSGLDHATHYARRFGFRRHYCVRPWSNCVEVYWGGRGQLYITPVSPSEVSVALLTRDRHLRIDTALADFPELRKRLSGAEAGPERGAVSVSRRLQRVFRGNIALLGDASGSVDAITGEGLSLTFRQAGALADAIAAGDLRAYEAGHRKLLRRPALMARLLLSMDRCPLIRRRALHAMAAKPGIFANLLAVHTGQRPAAQLLMSDIVPLGLRMLAVR